MNIRIGLATLFIFALISCNKKAEDSSKNNSTVMSSVASNLQQIESGFTPTSMSSSSTTLAKPMSIKPFISGSGPCSGMDFFQCQSVLVKLYFAIGKSMVGMATQLVTGVGNHLGQLADGAQGSANTDDGGTIDYQKTSDSVFSVLAKNSSGTPGLSLSVNDNTYTLKFDIQAVDSTSTDNVKLEMTITYTSATAWTINLYMINATCDTSDPGAPERIKIVLSRESTLWTGKAMLYHPHWSTGTASCSNSSTPVAMYTDFVGSDSATKGNLFMIPGGVSDLTTLTTDYPFSAFCTNFSASCGSGTGLIPTSLPTSYVNPFCSTTVGVAPTFNNTCSGTDTNVANSSFGAASLWVTPAALSATSITLPTNL